MTYETRIGLYPPLMPYSERQIAVGGGHTLYVEECGNPAGIPVVILHGGPGGGCNPHMRRYHDPGRYRIVLFDQRGCGRSTPYASLEANTTQDLVRDMERIRHELGIARWQLFGGSWGSTLALAYAQAHPDRVLSMILRGIFLLTQAEIRWFYQEGCSWIFPEAFAEFQKLIPEGERGDMVGAYYKRLTSPDKELQRAAARAWSMWEGMTLSLIPDLERLKRFADDRYSLAFARIECHYFINRGFLERDGALLEGVARMKHIPGTIVQGRYDVVTPLRSGWRLHAAWPASELKIVPDAGHAMSEPGIVHELVSATRRHARQFA